MDADTLATPCSDDALSSLGLPIGVSTGGVASWQSVSRERVEREMSALDVSELGWAWKARASGKGLEAGLEAA